MSLKHYISNEKRVSLLKELLREKKYLRIIETHSGISGLIVNSLKIEIEENGKKKNLEFDGFWESSLTDSASKGLPDIELVSQDSRLMTINQILDVTDKPMIVDGDTGGDYSQFEYFIHRLERAGVSAVIIEDKVFPKRNSLESGIRQTLEDPCIFAEKIRRGVSVRKNNSFLIIARVEALIAGLSQDEALRRAEAYLRAGADGIMIHSKSESPDEILEFAKRFFKLPKSLIESKYLVCVPTSYNIIRDSELAHAGFNIIIHANHMLRASYKAMEDVSKEILIKDRSFDSNPICSTTKEIFSRVGFLDVKEKDAQTQKNMSSKLKIIMPAAGEDELSQKLNKPKSMIDLNGKCLLERQMEEFQKCGITDFALIKGFRGEQIQLENIRYYENKRYSKTGILHSLFCAQEELSSSAIISYADVLINKNIISALVDIDKKEEDIVIVVDESFKGNKLRTDRVIELVITERREVSFRRIVDNLEEKALRIGARVDIKTADYEFIGVIYLSENGVKIFKQVYKDCSQGDQRSKFHESSCFEKANLTDFIQEIIDRGYEVKILKVFKGWAEIHDLTDINLIKESYKYDRPTKTSSAVR